MLLIAFQALTFTILVNEGLGCYPTTENFASNGIGYPSNLHLSCCNDYQMDIAAGNIAGSAVESGLHYVPEYGLFGGRSLPKREVKPFATDYFPFLKVFIISKMLSFYSPVMWKTYIGHLEFVLKTKILV